jgi:uncharacterized Zn finger protein
MEQEQKEEGSGSDCCPTCLRDYEIVALKFRFRGPMALMVCGTCGLVQSEKTAREDISPAGTNIRTERNR